MCSNKLVCMSLLRCYKEDIEMLGKFEMDVVGRKGKTITL